MPRGGGTWSVLVVVPTECQLSSPLHRKGNEGSPLAAAAESAVGNGWMGPPWTTPGEFAKEEAVGVQGGGVGGVGVFGLGVFCCAVVLYVV